MAAHDGRASEKPIHSIVVDAGPIISGDPSVSSLLQQCEQIVTIPAVISEIRDPSTRARLESTLLPFLQTRNPRPESFRFICDFAKKTGDFAVLSKIDLQILALTYDIECERNKGDWRLRKTPGQKRTNGPPPKKEKEIEEILNSSDEEPSEQNRISSELGRDEEPKAANAPVAEEGSSHPIDQTEARPIAQLSEGLNSMDLSAETAQEIPEEAPQEVLGEDGEDDEDDEDCDGWITPSNIRIKEKQDPKIESIGVDPVTMQAASYNALITTDFAMQNVLLQMNLNLLSTSLQRIKHVKTFILRCHACFHLVRDLSKQFCARCGGPTLTRVTCTTNQNGEFKIHLKQKMQWNNRGNRYSVPKPVPGAANYKVKGGGKGGWGNDLIFSEDQKEYVRAITEEKRLKNKDLMDPDYWPSILGGDRSRGGGRPKVGAGRTVNSKKRRS